MIDAERRFAFGELVINVQHRAARIAEDVFNIFASQRFKQYPRPTNFHKFTSQISKPLAHARGTAPKRKPRRSFQLAGVRILSPYSFFGPSHRRAMPE